MSRSLRIVCTGLFALALSTLCAAPANAQAPEVKEKAPMYTYVANWAIPRAHWGEMEKAYAADKSILDKALSDGTLVGFGNDEAYVHQSDGMTHDNWWSSMSMAGLLKVLDQFYASGNTSSSALDSATKHSDLILSSRYYNWHPGAFKNAYVHVSAYRMKNEAPDDEVDSLATHLIVPMLEKLLSDGDIVEYEIDQEAIHTTDPNTFWIVYVCPKAEGIDKVNAAVGATIKNHPLAGIAFGATSEGQHHRDELNRGDGVFK